jgi:glutaredoxin
VSAILLLAGSALAYRATRAAAPHPTETAQVARPLALPPVAEATGSAAAPTDPGLSPVALARQREFIAFEEGRSSGSSMDAPALSATPEPEPPPVQVAPPAQPSIEGVRVVVYTASWCPVCRRAKQWMAVHGIRYEDHDIEASRDDARAMRELNPRGSIPTFDIEGDVMVGFREGDLLAAMQRAARRRAEHPTLGANAVR